VIARARQGQDSLGLRGMPAAGCQCADAAFEIGQALLQDIGGGVHDTGVDIAELGKGKQVGGVLGALELVAGGLIDRHGAAAGGRIRLLAGMKLSGVEAEFAVDVHGLISILPKVGVHSCHNKPTHRRIGRPRACSEAPRPGMRCTHRHPAQRLRGRGGAA